MGKLIQLSKVKFIVIGVLTALIFVSVLEFSTSISASAPPTEISSCAGLLAIDDLIENQTVDYVVTSNIDCAGVANFTPIGLGGIWAGFGYAGVFDGQDHSIRNLTINSTGVDFVGLFSKLEGGTIKNLILKDGSVTSNFDLVGGLVGATIGTGTNVIDRVCSSLSVSGVDSVGGLVGKTDQDTTIARSCTTGTVTGDYYVGGLVGEVYDYTEIDRSYTTGTVTGADDVGGLVGYGDDDNIITDSYSLSNLISSNDCGGIVSNSYETNAYRTYYGGLLDCGDPDGLVGEDDDIEEVTDSFWDLRGGLNPATTKADELGATKPRSTAQMKDITTYTTDIELITPWDFSTIWAIDAGLNNGYPYLRQVITESVELEVDDNDGVSKAVEAAAPNSGDANNDGIQDSEQPTVTSTLNPVSGKYVVLEAGGVCSSNDSVLLEQETKVTTKDDDGFDYPAGLLDFSLTGCGVGGTETITQYYYGEYDLSNVVLRKYDKANDTYTTISDALLSIVTIGGQQAVKAVYTVTDGGVLDADGIANGTIVDPVGLGTEVETLADTGSETFLLPIIGLTLMGTTVALLFATRKRITKIAVQLL
jgi:LPXTG-motif cell wall-anchored protein